MMKHDPTFLAQIKASLGAQDSKNESRHPMRQRSKKNDEKDSLYASKTEKQILEEYKKALQHLCSKVFSRLEDLLAKQVVEFCQGHEDRTNLVVECLNNGMLDKDKNIVDACLNFRKMIDFNFYKEVKHCLSECTFSDLHHHQIDQVEQSALEYFIGTPLLSENIRIPVSKVKEHLNHFKNKVIYSLLANRGGTLGLFQHSQIFNAPIIITLPNTLKEEQNNPLNFIKRKPNF